MSSKKLETNAANNNNNNKEETPSDELTAVVEELLNSLSNKFAGVSSEIFAKMDEMSRRLDNLESALKANQASDSASSKP
ncbi:hypothetical protein PG994_014285 [Apiospora phragmitis]|uniref:Heat shock factor binding protein 1 n=1 Tax=Apiospora phragmitis TaxID=2905665 RepID=A0ABR1T3W5_9PEZI